MLKIAGANAVNKAQRLRNKYVLSLAIKVFCIDLKVFAKASVTFSLASNHNVTVQYHCLILPEVIIPLVGTQLAWQITIYCWQSPFFFLDNAATPSYCIQPATANKMLDKY